MKLTFKEYELQGWERVANEYDACFGKITPQAANALVDFVEIKEKSKVLDIACGPGYVASLAAKKSKDVTGIDFSAGMIPKAKAFFPEINFQVMDAEELLFNDLSFDVALMNFGILHFAHPEQAIKEVFRVLKPGGTFLFTMWNTPAKSKAFECILSALKEEGDLNVPLPEGPDFFKFSDPEVSRDVISQMGFSKVEFKELDLVWVLDSPKELFQAFYRGGIRIGGVLRAQTPDAICRIIESLERKTRGFQKNGRLEIPVSVLMYKAEK
ncbi:MAG: class I SAM-dependent methyltransferase [Rhabdochlamydiaceae bacterium]|jgi:SAM-dependent methyltransferase